MKHIYRCCLTGVLAYLWRRTEPGAGTNHLGGVPGESGWSFSPAGEPGIPWWVGTDRGRGDEGQTKRTEGTVGAGWRRRLEGVGDLEDGGTGREEDVRQTRWLTEWYKGWFKEAKWDADILMSKTFRGPLHYILPKDEYQSKTKRKLYIFILKWNHFNVNSKLTLYCWIYSRKLNLASIITLQLFFFFT